MYRTKINKDMRMLTVSRSAQCGSSKRAMACTFYGNGRCFSKVALYFDETSKLFNSFRDMIGHKGETNGGMCLLKYEDEREILSLMILNNVK